MTFNSNHIFLVKKYSKIKINQLLIFTTQIQLKQLKTHFHNIIINFQSLNIKNKNPNRKLISKQLQIKKLFNWKGFVYLTENSIH